MKSVRIRSFSSLYFPVFGLNTERYSVYLRIKSENGKIRSTKTETFFTVLDTPLRNDNQTKPEDYVKFADLALRLLKVHFFVVSR